MGLLEKRNFYFGKKQTHENCSWCQDLTATIFGGTPFVHLLLEILYAGETRNITQFRTPFSSTSVYGCLPFKFPQNPIGK